MHKMTGKQVAVQVELENHLLIIITSVLHIRSGLRPSPRHMPAGLRPSHPLYNNKNDNSNNDSGELLSFDHAQLTYTIETYSAYAHQSFYPWSFPSPSSTGQASVKELYHSWSPHPPWPCSSCSPCSASPI